MPALKFPKLIRRRTDAPTLKERAATLKAGLSRIVRRPVRAEDADQGRRSVMVASVAAAVPLPALAYSAAASASVPAVPARRPSPHPDQALLDTEAALSRAFKLKQSADQAARLAWQIIEDVLRAFPAALAPLEWEEALVGVFAARKLLNSHRDMHQVPREDDADNKLWRPVFTAKTLRTMIEHAVPVLGQGGQTPHRIKRWRELLPMADAFDARVAAARSFSDYSRLQEQAFEAEAAVSDLRYEISRTIATTPEGLAVHVRRLAADDYRRRNSEFETLLLSAAALTGTELPRPDFDVAEWVAAWERHGGRIERMNRRYGRPEWAFSYPSFAGASEEFKHEVRALGEQRHIDTAAISDWLDANR